MFKKLQLKTMALLALLLIGAGSAWAEKITDYTKIVSGQKYYIGATVGETDYYFVTDGSETRTGVQGTSTTDKSEAVQLIFEGSGASWSIKFASSGYYLTLASSKANSKVNVQAESANWTASNVNSLIHLAINNYCLQKNSGTSLNFGSYASGQKDVWLEPAVDNRQETTVTIDASAIGNTDIYTNEDINLLGATVKCGDNVIAGAEVTWESSDTEVATIDEEGEVTLHAAGTTTITATYDGDSEYYKGSSAVYVLTVTDSTPYVQPLSFDIPLNGGSESFNNGSTSGNATDEVSLTKNRVKLTYTRNSGSLYTANGAIRFYKSNTLTFEAPEGYYITSIVLTQSNAQADDITADKGTWTASSHTWSGLESTVVLSRPNDASSYMQLTNAAITLSALKNVETPTFTVETGSYLAAQNVTIECATDGAEIYYTLDETTPTKSSTKYTGAFEVNSTTTIKAIAYNGEDDSNVATVKLTFPIVYANIAAFIEANTTAGLNLTGAQVVYAGTDYKSNSCIYVKDATGTINLFGSELSFETGDMLSGAVLGTYTVYKTQKRVTEISNSTLVKSGNTTVVPEIISGDNIADHVGELVTIKNTQITESNDRYYICAGSIQMYDNFNVGYTPETGKDCDVTGIVITYEASGSIIYEIAPRYESDIVYLDNAVAVEIGEAGMATFSCDKALDFTGVDAIAAYFATVTNEGKITFTRIKKVPANTGLLIRNAEGEDQGAVAAVNVPVLDGAADATTGNALVAVDTEIASLATDGEGCVNYILNLNKVNGNLGFYKAAGHKVAAGKAYLQVPAAAARGSFAISFDDETTGIATVENASMLNENYYNLNGQRIVAPQKGLYIVNGKKVVLK